MAKRLTAEQKAFRARMKELKMRYVSGIPQKPLPRGRVLVHNHVVPQTKGLPNFNGSHAWRRNGFLAWTQALSDDLEVCSCDFGGIDPVYLRGLIHYRVRRKP